jgi:hypothetical protein
MEDNQERIFLDFLIAQVPVLAVDLSDTMEWNLKSD